MGTHTSTANRLGALVMGSVMLLAAGCNLLPGNEAEEFVPVTMTAKFTTTPVKIDGVLDDAAWASAEVYKLSLGQDRLGEGKVLAEGGQARLAWDGQYVYVAVKFIDSDIVAEGDEDQLHHYKLGDLVELFLKPANNDNETWYWELYATPAGKKTTFWFPGRGRITPGCFEKYTSGLRVAATCAGTLNKWEDKDRYWTAEMAVPVKDLTARGEKLGPGSTWRVLVARYNYTRYLPWQELSMTPKLSRTNYHWHEDYGLIRFAK